MRTLRYKVDRQPSDSEKVAQSEIPAEITIEYLSEITRKMRHQQRRYEATLNKDVLEEKRRYEALVDTVVSKVLDKQGSLF